MIRVLIQRQIDGKLLPAVGPGKLLTLSISELQHLPITIFAHPQRCGTGGAFRAEKAAQLDPLSREIHRNSCGHGAEAAGRMCGTVQNDGPGTGANHIAFDGNGPSRAACPSGKQASGAVHFEPENARYIVPVIANCARM